MVAGGIAKSGQYAALVQLMADGLPALGVDFVYEDPDLLHLIGLPDERMKHAARRAKTLRIPYIWSPMGCMCPWNAGVSKPGKAFIAGAAATHSSSLMENAPGNRYIPNPVVTGKLSAAGFLEKIHSLYNEVADSHEKAMRNAAKAQAAETCRGMESGAAGVMECLLYSKYMAGRGRMPQWLTDEVRNVFTSSDYDEEIFAHKLKQCGLLAFAARLERTAAEASQLTEGFMPVPMAKAPLRVKKARL